MMPRQVLYSFAVLLLTALTAYAASPQTRPATQPAEPFTVKQTLQISHLASYVPGLIPLDEIAFSDDSTTQKYIDAYSHLARADQRLARAVRDKLGPDALGPLHLNFPQPSELVTEGWAELREGGDPFVAEVDKATVQEKGDTAVIHFSTGQTLKARRIKGRWKIDFPDLKKMLAQGPAGYTPAATEMIWRTDQQAKIDDGLAKDVAGGKLNTVEQIQAEQQRRVQEAVARHGSPTQ